MINFVDSFLNSTYYTILMPLIAFFAVSLTIVLFVSVLNTKSVIIKRIFSIVIIFLLFISYQIVPYFFTVRAVLSDDIQGVIKNYNLAIKTAITPIHKGLLSLDYAVMLTNYKMIEEAKIKYEEAYSYLKEYKPNIQWLVAGRFYVNIFDYKKAFEIFSFNNNFLSMAEIFILQNDYQNALKYSTKAVNKNQDAWTLVQRAAIYKKLGKNDLAEQDFNKALPYAKQRKISLKKLQFLYDNPQAYYKERIDIARKNLGLD